MRKLKLQMNMTMDGFVAGPDGKLDWMASDKEILDFVISLVDTSDTLILGRRMTSEFVNYWENVADNQPDSPEYTLGKKEVEIRKIVFSKTQSAISGRNVEVENGDLVTAVQALKNKPGKDILVYGGVQFAGALIENNLIDEYHFIVNPIAIGKGLQIFKERKPLQLKKSVVYKSGVVVNSYVNG